MVQAMEVKNKNNTADAAISVVLPYRIELELRDVT
jgi:hypothetical protein